MINGGCHLSWPNLSPCHQKYDQNLGRKSTEAKQLIQVEATAKLFPSAAELLYLLFDHAVDEVVHFSGKVAKYLLKGINLQSFFIIGYSANYFPIKFWWGPNNVGF